MKITVYTAGSRVVNFYVELTGEKLSDDEMAAQAAAALRAAADQLTQPVK